MLQHADGDGASRHHRGGAGRRLRRVMTLAGALGLMISMPLAGAAAAPARQGPATPARVPVGGPARQAALTAAASPAATGSCPQGSGSSVTVAGPKLWDPKTHSPFASPSCVTVSQASDLVNQVVQVSWSNFTPSSLPQYIPTTTEYPVEVAECPGTDPSSPVSCYGEASDTNSTEGLHGATTEAYATTDSQGDGSTPIQIQTVVDNPVLTCDQNNPCSLVITPAQGGNYPSGKAPVCSNHSAEDYFTSTGQAAFTNGPFSSCSWADRIVVPIHFAPVPGSCQFNTPDFTVEGSPLLLRAMTSWDTALCQGKNRINVLYNGTVSEPQARQDFLSGVTDVALTTEPETGSGKYHYTYAPVGVSAVAIAYWLDNDNTAQPYTGLAINPLLMTKMLTTSYSDNFQCTSGPPPPFPGCDSAVDHDPIDIMSDPEFRQLEQQMLGHGLQDQNDVQYTVPTVPQGNTDITWELTRWIAANAAASSFMKGNFDAWGEHVNTNYLNTQWPTQQLNSNDPFTVFQHLYSPVYPLARVATYQVENWLPSTTWIPVTNPGQPPNYPDLPQEAPGNRSLFAVLGEPDANAFALPTMKIENPAGDYVAPTPASMAAAVNDMTVASNGITRDDNVTSKDPAQYPMTMVVYAVVPTSGMSKNAAAKIAAWLDFVAGSGQKTGVQPGQLQPGYLPLPASMRAQTLKAAYEVLHQTGTQAPHSNNGTGNGGGGGSSGNGGSSSSISSSGANSGKGSASPSRPSAPARSKADAAYSSPDSGGFGMLLPLLLVVGALLALAGPSAMVLSRPGGRAAVIAGWRHVADLYRKPPPLRGRNK